MTEFTSPANMDAKMGNVAQTVAASGALATFTKADSMSAREAFHDKNDIFSPRGFQRRKSTMDPNDYPL